MVIGRGRIHNIASRPTNDEYAYEYAHHANSHVKYQAAQQPQDRGCN